MFAVARRLLQPKGTVKLIASKFAILEFTEGDKPRNALLTSANAALGLEGRAVSYDVIPSSKVAGKTEAKGLRLCDAASATGTIKFYDSMKGFGYVIGKDGQETRVNHSQVTDLGQCPIKLEKGHSVEFDVEPGTTGLLARNLRAAT